MYNRSDEDAVNPADCIRVYFGFYYNTHEEKMASVLMVVNPDQKGFITAQHLNPTLGEVYHLVDEIRKIMILISGEHRQADVVLYSAHQDNMRMLFKANLIQEMAAKNIKILPPPVNDDLTILHDIQNFAKKFGKGEPAYFQQKLDDFQNYADFLK